MPFHISEDTLTLGNLVPTYPRRASYWFRADTPGPKTFLVRAWSENGGEFVASTSFQVQPARPSVNLVPTAMGTSPATPNRGARVHLLGDRHGTERRAGGVHLLEDALLRLARCGEEGGDTLLAGTHSVPGLAAGVSHTATVKAKIPAGTPLGGYFLLACADDTERRGGGRRGGQLHRVTGGDVTWEAGPGGSLAPRPPAPSARPAHGVGTDTVQNLGGSPSGPRGCATTSRSTR